MLAAALLVLSALSPLGCSTAAALRPRPAVEDTLALVQLGIERHDHDVRHDLHSDTEWRGLLHPRRLRRNNTFPLHVFREGQRYHYVGSASYHLDLAGFHIHIYDVALYLNTSSPLWHSQLKRNRSEDISDMLDNVQFHTVTYSKFVNNQNMARFVDQMNVFAERRGLLSNASGDIKAYKQIYLDGPVVSAGTKISLSPGRNGITPVIGERDMGLVKSEFLGPLLLEAYLGPDTELPEFRDKVFAQLGMGMPSMVGDAAIVHGEAGDVVWSIILLVAIILVSLCCCCGCTWWCCRRRAPCGGAEKLEAFEAQQGGLLGGLCGQRPAPAPAAPKGEEASK